MVNDKTRGTLYVLICVALWALIPVVAKMGQTRLDNHQFLFWSSLVSFFLLGVLVILSGNFHKFSAYHFKDWNYLFILGLLGTYFYYLFLYLGYSKASGMEVLVVQYTWPILIVVFSIFVLKERLDTRKSAAIVLGFIGVIVVLTKGDFQSIHISNGPVIGLVGVGAACFALFSVLSKTVKKEPLGVVTVYFLTASIASFISMLYFSKFSLPSTTELMPILLNGILVNGISYVFWMLALRSTEASYLAPFTFLTPVLSAVYLVTIFNETFVPAYAVGLVFVVAGGLLNSLSKATT
ncbi:MAG: DMT family transporter [Gammaproteobacteria bacterium]|nr:DMT family transporter [Gammaproteobacteria bacterium]